MAVDLLAEMQVDDLFSALGEATGGRQSDRQEEQDQGCGRISGN